MLGAMANQDIETTLYNKRHKIVFKNGKHRYYIDGAPKPGVTTIMGKVLAKPDLMLWPLNMALMYIRKNSEKHAASLFYYVTEDDLENAAKAHVRKRDSGADVGTQVHALVELTLSNPVAALELALNTIELEVTRAWQAFTNWQDQVNPEVVAVEQLVYSPTLNFAGTFDSILKINGRVYLCDLKTTNASRSAPKGVYAEYFIQLGAYLYAYEEQRQYELAHGGTDLVQIDDLLVISCRKDGKMNTMSASDVGLTLDACIDLWKNTLFLHNHLARLKQKLEKG